MRITDYADKDSASPSSYPELTEGLDAAADMEVEQSSPALVQGALVAAALKTETPLEEITEPATEESSDTPRPKVVGAAACAKAAVPTPRQEPADANPQRQEENGAEPADTPPTPAPAEEQVPPASADGSGIGKPPEEKNGGSFGEDDGEEGVEGREPGDQLPEQSAPQEKESRVQNIVRGPVFVVEERKINENTTVRGVLCEHSIRNEDRIAAAVQGCQIIAVEQIGDSAWLEMMEEFYNDYASTNPKPENVIYAEDYQADKHYLWPVQHTDARIVFIDITHEDPEYEGAQKAAEAGVAANKALEDLIPLEEARAMRVAHNRTRHQSSQKRDVVLAARIKELIQENMAGENEDPITIGVLAGTHHYAIFNGIGQDASPEQDDALAERIKAAKPAFLLEAKTETATEAIVDKDLLTGYLAMHGSLNIQSRTTYLAAQMVEELPDANRAQLLEALSAITGDDSKDYPTKREEVQALFRDLLETHFKVYRPSPELQRAEEKAAAERQKEIESKDIEPDTEKRPLVKYKAGVFFAGMPIEGADVTIAAREDNLNNLKHLAKFQDCQVIGIQTAAVAPVFKAQLEELYTEYLSDKPRKWVVELLRNVVHNVERDKSHPIEILDQFKGTNAKVVLLETNSVPEDEKLPQESNILAKKYLRTNRRRYARAIRLQSESARANDPLLAEQIYSLVKQHQTKGAPPVKIGVVMDIKNYRAISELTDDTEFVERVAVMCKEAVGATSFATFQDFGGDPPRLREATNRIILRDCVLKLMMNSTEHDRQKEQIARRMIDTLSDRQRTQLITTLDEILKDRDKSNSASRAAAVRSEFTAQLNAWVGGILIETKKYAAPSN